MNYQRLKESLSYLHHGLRLLEGAAEDFEKHYANNVVASMAPMIVRVQVRLLRKVIEALTAVIPPEDRAA